MGLWKGRIRNQDLSNMADILERGGFLFEFYNVEKLSCIPKKFDLKYVHIMLMIDVDPERLYK